MASDVLFFQEVLIVIRQLRDDGQRFLQTRDLASCRLNVGLSLSNLSVNSVQTAAILLVLALHPTLSSEHVLRVGTLNGSS
ncbi:hypothetical protein D3C84_1204460 [compost metagenome]